LRGLLAAAPEVAAAGAPAIELPEPDAEPNLTGLHRTKLESAYFDTPDQWLSGNRMALRVRKIGRKRIQTLKAPAPGPSGLQNFLEIEAEIGSDRPQLEAVT